MARHWTLAGQREPASLCSNTHTMRGVVNTDAQTPGIGSSQPLKQPGTNTPGFGVQVATVSHFEPNANARCHEEILILIFLLISILLNQ